MIRINGAEHEWRQGMTVMELVRELGYKLRKPLILVIIDDRTVPYKTWESVQIPDPTDVRIEKILMGG